MAPPTDTNLRLALDLVSVVVRDYDEALDFYRKRLGFLLVEDNPLDESGKRWVVVAPPGAMGARVLLAKAANEEQAARIGNQTGGRVFLFLSTNNFSRDYQRLKDAGVRFVREPRSEDYGRVAVFEDLYGNLWDLIQPTSQDP